MLFSLFFVFAEVEIYEQKIREEFIKTDVEFRLKILEIKIERLNKQKQPRISIASWYDYRLDGIEWSKNHRTCASRDYPRKTTLRVKNINNNKYVDCFVNDYGPEIQTGRQIDLSSFAFSQIADLKLGLIKVEIIKL